jgi:hypothetical protein
MSKLNTAAYAAAPGDYIYIAVRPAASKDKETLYILSSPLGPTSVTANTVITTGDKIYAEGMLFNNSDFSSGNLEQRCVSWGLKVRANTPADEAHPMMYAATSPDHLGYAVANLMNQTLTDPHRTQAQMSPGNVLLAQSTSDDYAFQNIFRATSYYNDISTTISAPSLLVLGGVGTANVQIEFVAHWEFRGDTVAAYSRAQPSANNLTTAVFSAVESQLQAPYPYGAPSTEKQQAGALKAAWNAFSESIDSPMLKKSMNSALEELLGHSIKYVGAAALSAGAAIFS